MVKESDAKLFFISEECIHNSITKKKTAIEIKKYKQLLERREQEFKIIVNQGWFKNETKTKIPKNIEWLLSLGAKFALHFASSQFPLLDCITEGEDIIQTLGEKNDQEIARTQLTHMIKKQKNKKLNTVGQTKKFLKKNSDMLILDADKGNVTVAMNKNDYKNKMQQFLNDITTYNILKQDPTSKLQTKNNNLVDKLFKGNVIDSVEKTKLSTFTATAPRIYGLPKIHKQGIPLRPITSCVNAPSQNLCQYMVNILKNLTKDSIYNIKDAISFKEKVNNAYIFDDGKLVSFDVVSLFPSIPVDYALEIIKEKWSQIEKITEMKKSDLHGNTQVPTKRQQIFQT
ncbi:uncharacterized protein LOC119666107 [Teleopsis dalmanni]|uniref:uncharacterized protein LOC119663763 n=1 Tax=Teleopsis dalmanni TaxID=139649 RepID=UPI0018CDB8E7|nr:uncharacterized protein LOC119663763 [Teleopsis dalmanni]XP_037931313.1 uncharacterized protein LOC119666107 [Teleopsis dalmanni]